MEAVTPLKPAPFGGLCRFWTARSRFRPLNLAKQWIKDSAKADLEITVWESHPTPNGGLGLRLA